MWLKRLLRGSLFLLLLWSRLLVPVYATNPDTDEISLYASAAVLMDADTGRVLYEKNGDVPMANASTTKIMTCILVLEEGNLEDKIHVSSYAASMPKVKMYIRQGEEYYVRDLLYSMMLESHNDSAVALAEYIGKRYLEDSLREKNTGEYTIEESKRAVEAFASLMNERAAEIGCENTNFITPNGLDAVQNYYSDTGELVSKEHLTTASDLAKIMSYCITKSSKKDLFLDITRQSTYSFAANGRSFSCVNHNAFLQMMEGALSGKTGFTNKAGYCYVGALKQGEKIFSLALLACGWPNHKSWKWSDSRELFSYGLKEYVYHDYSPEIVLPTILVENGAGDTGNPYAPMYVELERKTSVLPIHLLTTEGEQVVSKLHLQKSLSAPVCKGQEVGEISYYLVDARGEQIWLTREKVCTKQDVAMKDFGYIWRFVRRQFLLF